MNKIYENLYVKDLLHKHNEFIKIAKHSGNNFPEDTTQTVWLKLIEYENKHGNINHLLGEDKKLNKGYIYSMVKNQSITDSNRENFLGKDEFNEQLDPYIGEGVDLSIEAFLRELPMAIQSLPEDHREKLLLYAEGYNYREIGEMYGNSKQAIHKLLEKVKKKIILSILEEYGLKVDYYKSLLV